MIFFYFQQGKKCVVLKKKNMYESSGMLSILLGRPHLRVCLLVIYYTDVYDLCTFLHKCCISHFRTFQLCFRNVREIPVVVCLLSWIKFPFNSFLPGSDQQQDLWDKNVLGSIESSREIWVHSFSLRLVWELRFL